MKRLFSIAVVLVAAMNARGSVVRFVDDYPGFTTAAGQSSTIDFETLPNGSPSHSSVYITDTFNYDAQGAHFSPSNGVSYIGGNVTSGFGIVAEAPNVGQQTSLLVDFTNPMGVRGVGGFTGGHSTLSVYDGANQLLGSVSASGGSFFFGIVSTTPIVRAVFSRGDFAESLDSFVLAPIPEPATLGLLAVGVVLLRRRR